MPNPLISLDNVRLTLPSRAGAVEILRGADLSVKSGDAIGIVGPSGSGKTTLADGDCRARTGELPARSQVAGTHLNGQSEDALTAFRRDAVGIVFQSFHLIPTMTALENVAVPLEFKGHSDAMEMRTRGSLSASASAIASTTIPANCRAANSSVSPLPAPSPPAPRIVLADEPTGNLDQETGKQIMDLLFALKREDGVTLLLVTHDRALAERCDRIAEVRDGRIVAGAHA